MTEPGLRVNVEELNWDPAEVTVPGVPAVPPGSDPMSVMVAAIMPGIATAVTKAVAETLAREGRFDANLSAAGSAYQNTDGASQQQIQSAGGAIEPASAAAGTGAAQSAGSAAGQGGQLGQMMGMAGQAAQIPMQMMGMAAAIPQGIMQGVQSAMQQVGQMSGMGGQGEKDGEQKEAGQLREPTAETPDENRADREPEPAAEAGQNDGAGSGDTSGERVPEPERPQAQGVPTEPRPAPTRPAESSPENVL
jgi:hypothetical protein